MSQEKVALTAQNNTNEFKKNAIFLAARAKVEEMIRAQIRNIALQAEMIRNCSELLEQQRALATEESWEQLRSLVQAEIDRSKNAQPIEGFLPEQLKRDDPIVAQSMENIHHHFQQFQSLKTGFATAHAAAVPQVGVINTGLTAMRAALAPVLASSAPTLKPAERKTYEEEAIKVGAWGLELASYASSLDKHIQDVGEHVKAIKDDYELIQKRSPNRPVPHVVQSAFEETQTYFSSMTIQRKELENTITLNTEVYNQLARIAKVAFNVDIAPYSDLSNNPNLFLKAPRPSTSIGSCGKENREEEEKSKGLFSGYASSPLKGH